MGLNKESRGTVPAIVRRAGRILDFRNYWLEGTKWLNAALTKPAQQSTTEGFFRARALSEYANLAERLDDIPRMRESAERSLRLAQEIADKREIAIARFYMAWAIWRQNDDDRALAIAEQSFTDFQELNDLFWITKSYRQLGGLLVAQGKLTAKERFVHGFELAQAAGERVELAEALQRLGYYNHIINQPDEARKYAAEASELLKQIGSNLYDPKLLLAELAWLTGDYKEAKALYEEIQTGLGLLGEKNTRSVAIGFLGTLALEEGDFVQARILLEASLATAREIQNYTLVSVLLIELGNLFYLEGNLDEFKRKYQESIPLVKKLTILDKSECLFFTLRLFDRQTGSYTISILGALYHVQKETQILFDPIFKRFYDHAEAYARQVLGPGQFDIAFADGQKYSLDEALDLVLKMIEEM